MRYLIHKKTLAQMNTASQIVVIGGTEMSRQLVERGLMSAKAIMTNLALWKLANRNGDLIFENMPIDDFYAEMDVKGLQSVAELVEVLSALSKLTIVFEGSAISVSLVSLELNHAHNLTNISIALLPDLSEASHLNFLYAVSQFEIFGNRFLHGMEGAPFDVPPK